MGFDMEYLEIVFKACGVALIASVCVAVVGRASGAAALAIRLGGGVALFAVLMLLLSENLAELQTTIASVSAPDGELGDSFTIMLRALGISLISKFCSDICRDCGESTLASGVESVGRMAMIALCIPVLADILSFAADVLERGM